MSCEYCTPMIDEDTGESLEFCKEFIHIEEHHRNTLIRTFLAQDRDDGSWWRTVLLADDWPERTLLPVVTTYEAPPFCPHCGRRLYGHADEL